MLSFLKPKHEPAEELPTALAELLFESVRALSEGDADIEAGCKELADALRQMDADPEQVRAIACEAVYSGDDEKAEQLMSYLAAQGYGPGSNTVRQPEREPAAKPERQKEQLEQPAICAVNLLAELASPDAYSAVLVGDRGVGLTMLIKALIGARLRHPCPGISITIADLHSEGSWRGLESISNTVVQIAPRDPKFLETIADLVGQVAREIQSRVAQRSINARSPHLGSRKWPHHLLAINGWQNVTEAVSLLSRKQIYDHPNARQLLADFRYCLTTGDKVGVTTIVASDRLSNCGLTATALDKARVFALGAIRPGGKGGYRAVDAIVASKESLPDSRDRARLQALLGRCKLEKIPIVLALSGGARIGLLNDFRDSSSLKELYEERRAMK